VRSIVCKPKESNRVGQSVLVRVSERLAYGESFRFRVGLCEKLRLSALLLECGQRGADFRTDDDGGPFGAQ